jgi:hypothetical protein
MSHRVQAPKAPFLGVPPQHISCHLGPGVLGATPDQPVLPLLRPAV